jgi:hypothetical protein
LILRPVPIDYGISARQINAGNPLKSLRFQLFLLFSWQRVRCVPILLPQRAAQGAPEEEMSTVTISIGEGVFDPQHGQVLGIFLDPEAGEVYSHPAATGDGRSPDIFYGRHPQIAALRCAVDLDEVAEQIAGFGPHIAALAECEPEDRACETLALRERIESRIANLDPFWDADDYFEYEIRDAGGLADWWRSACETHGIAPDAADAAYRLGRILSEPRVLRLDSLLERAQDAFGDAE